MFLRPGKGKITVNGRPFENYFTTEAARAMVRQPLLATETADKFDVLILANGGGITGQAGAARLGIARALIEFNAELRGKLKKLGFLTRDPRAARAQEVRSEGRSQAVPVLQALDSCSAARPVVLHALPSSSDVFASRTVARNPRAQISLWTVLADRVALNQSRRLFCRQFQ